MDALPSGVKSSFVPQSGSRLVDDRTNLQTPTILLPPVFLPAVLSWERGSFLVRPSDVPLHPASIATRSNAPTLCMNRTSGSLRLGKGHRTKRDRPPFESARFYLP